LKKFIDTFSLYCHTYYKDFTSEDFIDKLSLKNNQLDKSFSKLDEYEKYDFIKNLENKSTLNIKKEHKTLNDISVLDLPLIAVLNNNEFCIIENIMPDASIKVISSINNKTTSKIISDISFNTIFTNEIYLINETYVKEDKEYDFNISKKNWLFETLNLSKKLYIDVILASILINIFVLASPLFTMNVYDRVIPNNAIETLWVFAIGVIFVYIIDASLKFIRSYFLELAAKKSDIIISSLLFNKILNIKQVDTPNSTGIFANHIKGFDLIRNFLTSATLSLLIDLPFSILFLIVIWYIGGSIVLIPILIILFILLFTLMINPYLQKSIEKTHIVHSKKNSLLIETISNLELFKSFGKTQWLRYEWNKTNNDLASQSLKSRMLASGNTTLIGLFIQLNIVLVVIYGVYQINDSLLSMGGLIGVIILASRVIAPMGQIAALISSYNDAYIAYKNLDEIIKKDDEDIQNKQYIKIENDFDVDIEFKNVCFKYDNESDYILEDISFKINKGEKVAIIGKIGSGKTTILKLILKIYEVSSGTILFNGIDINQINPNSIRKSVGFVSQDYSLFSGTLRDNLSIKDSSISDETLLKCASIANIDSFIKNSNQGLDLKIYENGSNLSGGQRQCISIAREFVQNPSLMLLDEPSSALDQNSEDKLLANFQDEFQNKTAIIVTQKMNLLSLASRIIVIQNGKVYLDGNKDAVIKKLS